MPYSYFNRAPQRQTRNRRDPMTTNWHSEVYEKPSALNRQERARWMELSDRRYGCGERLSKEELSELRTLRDKMAA